MSTITGRVADESGEPVEGVRIFATRMMFFEGRRRLVPIGTSSIQTDDEGEYRIPRLSPGNYYVMATTKETWTVTENGQDRLVGYMPTYFPGATTTPEARRVTLAVGRPPAPSTSRSCPDGRPKYPARRSTRASVRSPASA